ncbi:MAG: polysaccharide export protein [Candidatus Omnitrophica bacterium]|nr:polysaccharide export protein [Candidatus Omnitrophota bacterium]
MKKILSLIIILTVGAYCNAPLYAQEAVVDTPYTVGIDDILEISVLQPDQLLRVVNVAPDGNITFPYIGTVKVKGLTVAEIKTKVQDALADGYMKYPVVVVSLQESRSRRFFVYGEVMKPGTYAIAENTSVLRAISMAGGFSKFGSSSRVKVLRAKEEGAGYETMKIDIKKVMNGSSDDDILLKAGDMVVVSEGVF